MGLVDLVLSSTLQKEIGGKIPARGYDGEHYED
jgi:hypothetical protein